FIVIIFQESTGETIFSKRFDRLGIANPNFLVEDRSISNASCHCSIAQHSPENCINGSKKGISNEPALNNDNFNCKSNLGKTNRQVSVEKEKEVSKLVEYTAKGYVSFSRNYVEGTLMADGSASFKRRVEAANIVYNSLNLYFVPLQKVTSNCKPNEAKGPTCASEWCSDLMDIGEASKPNSGALWLKRFVGHRPKKVEAKRNKAMTVKKIANRCRSSKPIQALVNLGGGRAKSQRIQDEVESIGESLHDSNIENINCIFLNNLNHVMAEEIWKVGTGLGVHSTNHHQAMIQRISALQGSKSLL
ncbi:hypothetical protein Ancab_036447, partial [Ancistrocladus abbreviatus]